MVHPSVREKKRECVSFIQWISNHPNATQIRRRDEELHEPRASYGADFVAQA